jgi:hypothetical protein
MDATKEFADINEAFQVLEEECDPVLAVFSYLESDIVFLIKNHLDEIRKAERERRQTR